MLTSCTNETALHGIGVKVGLTNSVAEAVAVAILSGVLVLVLTAEAIGAVGVAGKARATRVNSAWTVSAAIVKATSGPTAVGVDGAAGPGRLQARALIKSANRGKKIRLDMMGSPPDNYLSKISVAKRCANVNYRIIEMG
jgi:hypothetical protein